MNVFICFDDEEYVEELIKRLESFQCDEELLFESYTETPGIARMIEQGQAKDFDLAFIGGIINGRNGFALGKMLKRNNPDCILIYICDDYKYIHEGFRSDAFQMLMKPQKKLLELEFTRAVKFYKKIHFQVTFHTRDGKDLNFYPRDIQYIETNNDVVSVITDLSRYYGRFDDFSKVKTQLKEYHFFPMHPRYFINMEAIDLIRNGELIMDNGDYIPTSAMNREVIDDAIQAFAPLL